MFFSVFYICGLGWFLPLMGLETIIFYCGGRSLEDMAGELQAWLGLLTLEVFIYAFCFLDPLKTLVWLIAYVLWSFATCVLLRRIP